MRFIRQRDQYSCGPIAILNALKWTGISITYRSHFKKIKTLCKTTMNWGTTPENITKVLLDYSEHLNFEIKELVTLKSIDKHLKAGGALILEYWFNEDGIYDGHYVFIFQRDGHDFITVNNMNAAPAAQPCTRQMLKSMLRCKKYRHTGSPSAWLINKND